ncbi:SDR family oxidoreductase [Allosediminivita pacifica]|uniref:Putative oxidoreductase n=1 Tax=Allosediminivita pacifica TaxID=1267769 RepID=A0A2T6AQD8_9RHOB|nr:SDR family NAD(P)-dependent oxidoreductase [Allosediminivita pacifica]PTX46041.1 putative oxidoreductase [Allosediminivita pacifica]GGB18795.1 short-chain dehydrogenase [Allosediminivita pacifica]
MALTNRTILITGGNSGIGRALAEALQAKGNRIIITGRKPHSLQAALDANPAMAGYTLDVTDEAALASFPARLLSEHPDLDTVILNAGIMEAEDYTADPVQLDVAERTIATNLTAPIRMAAALLPHLQGRPKAALVTVSSGLAFVPKAANPVYSATKAAIHSWSQALRHQLRGTSVAVHEIAPPLVGTELTPGQSKVAAAMPLQAFTDEVVGILSRDEVPDEVLVSRVDFQRRAEAEGRFAETFAAING